MLDSKTWSRIENFSKPGSLELSVCFAESPLDFLENHLVVDRVCRVLTGERFLKRPHLWKRPLKYFWSFFEMFDLFYFFSSNFWPQCKCISTGRSTAARCRSRSDWLECRWGCAKPNRATSSRPPQRDPNAYPSAPKSRPCCSCNLLHYDSGLV